MLLSSRTVGGIKCLSEGRVIDLTKPCCFVHQSSILRRLLSQHFQLYQFFNRVDSLAESILVCVNDELYTLVDKFEISIGD